MSFRISTIPLIGLAIAEVLSLLGNQVAAVALPILVLQYTQSPLAAGIASVGNIVPIAISALLGGRAIDRFGAWLLSVISDLLSFISVFALPLAFMYSGNLSPTLIFLIVFAGALFDPTGVAARQTLVPGLARLAGKPLETVNTVRGGLENGADFIGPIIGVGLIGFIGTLNTFFVNAASFLFCAVIFVLTVPKKRNRLSKYHQRDILLGVRFIFGNARLRALAISGMVANFVLLPFLGLLLPVLATQVLRSTALLGLSLSGFGISATLGALSFSKLGRVYSRSLIFYGGLSTSALAIVLCGVFATPQGVVLWAALAGLLLGAGNPLEQTILQEETPQMIRGQVFTSLTAIRFAAGPLGLLLGGVMTELTNVNLVLILGGGLLLLAAILGWYIAPLQDKR